VDGGLSHKKTPCFCHGLETQTCIGAMSTPDGSLMESWQNMAKSMAGFLEKPTILFAMFVYLGINTLSNIATKLSFLEGRPPERA
jgi:hypothetical protein